MDFTWVIGIILFIVLTIITWRLTVGYYKKHNSERMRKLWGVKTYYWESIVLISTAATFLVLYLLKWTSILAF